MVDSDTMTQGVTGNYQASFMGSCVTRSMRDRHITRNFTKMSFDELLHLVAEVYF